MLLLLSVGEKLATYEENTRYFLFPGPKLIRGQHGSIREVLMTRTYGFTVSECWYSFLVKKCICKDNCCITSKFLVLANDLVLYISVTNPRSSIMKVESFSET